MLLDLKEGADDAEAGVEEDPGLSHDQEQVVKLQLLAGVVAKGLDLKYTWNAIDLYPKHEGQLRLKADHQTTP